MLRFNLASRATKCFVIGQISPRWRRRKSVLIRHQALLGIEQQEFPLNFAKYCVIEKPSSPQTYASLGKDKMEEEEEVFARPTAPHSGDETAVVAKPNRSSSSRRESARRFRHSSKRYITSSITTFIDGWAASVAIKKRTRSVERDEENATVADSDHVAATPSSFDTVNPVQRPGSVGCASLPPTFTRRFSEQMLLQPNNIPRLEECSQASMEESEEKYLRRAQSKLQELLATERTYVEKSLKEVVEGYLAYMEEAKLNPEGRIKTPEDLLSGKDRIIFGNIRDIYEFHTKSIYPELEKAVTDPKLLRTLFEAKGNMFKKKYGRFCLNKPKSEYIIQHNDKYFAVLRLKQGFEQALSTQLMTPVQRVTRYQLLLKEVEKNLSLAGEEHAAAHADVQRACEVAHEIAEYANDMMFAGRIKGFNEDVTAQGLLLKRGHAVCFKRKSALKKPKEKQCQFFVFQETIIICENSQAPSETTAFPHNLEFFASFKMNKVIVRELVKNGTVFGFELERQENRCSPLVRKDSTSTSSTCKEYPVIVVHCDSEELRDEFLKTINDQIRELKNLANFLENPQHCSF